MRFVKVQTVKTNVLILTKFNCIYQYLRGFSYDAKKKQ